MFTSMIFDQQNKARGPVSELIFTDGTVMRIPPIRKSHRGGWYYHPILKQKNGKPIVLGRADEGRDKAKEVLEQLLTIAFEAGNWEMPELFFPIPETHETEGKSKIQRDGIIVQLPTQHGYVRFAAGSTSRYNVDNEWVLELVVPTTVITVWAKALITLSPYPAQSLSFSLEDEEISELLETLVSDGPVKAWSDQLKGKTMEVNGLADSTHTITGEQVTEWLETLEFKMDYDHKALEKSKGTYGVQTVYSDEESGNGSPLYQAQYNISDSVMALSPTYRKAYLKKGAVKALRALEVVLEASGVSIQMDLVRKYDKVAGEQREMLRSFTITLPEGGKHNRNGHTIQITPDSFEVVNCGYVEDEDNYIDDAKRLVLTELQSILDD